LVGFDIVFTTGSGFCFPLFVSIGGRALTPGPFFYLKIFVTPTPIIITPITNQSSRSAPMILVFQILLQINPPPIRMQAVAKIHISIFISSPPVRLF